MDSYLLNKDHFFIDLTSFIPIIMTKVPSSFILIINSKDFIINLPIINMVNFDTLFH